MSNAGDNKEETKALDAAVETSNSESREQPKQSDGESEASEEPAAEEEDDEKEEHKEGEGGDDEDAEEVPQEDNNTQVKYLYGLFPEADYDPDVHESADLVVVHGINRTEWTTEYWEIKSGRKPSANWIGNLGYAKTWMLYFYYDISIQRPDVLCPGGIEREAQKLLDQLVEIRRNRNEAHSVAPPLIFVAHDIGGIIVKKALILACKNPSKYGPDNIAWSTISFVGLGVPHRGNRLYMSDGLVRLFQLSEAPYHDFIVESVNETAKAIQQINSEFADTKLLIRTAFYNVFYKDPTYQTVQRVPFFEGDCYLDLPQDYWQAVPVPHLKLIRGDEAEQKEGKIFVDTILKKLQSDANIAPVGFGNHDYSHEKLFLSQAPPLVPPTRKYTLLNPYNLEARILNSDVYNEWKSREGWAFLHLQMHRSWTKVGSEALYLKLLESKSIVNPVFYFTFRKHDVRYNTISAMLTSFISQLLSRYRATAGTDPAVKMMKAHQAWTERDLIQLFESLHDNYLPPITYFISSIDDCESGLSSFLELLSAISEGTEKVTRFIFTSTTAMDSTLKKALPSCEKIDLTDATPEEVEEAKIKDRDSKSDTIEMIIGNQPLFAEFREDLTNLLNECQGETGLLSHCILSWIYHSNSAKTRAQVKRLLSQLSSPSPQRLMETIIAFIPSREQRARRIYLWTKFAFRPPTFRELAIATRLDEAVSEDYVQDLDYDEIREDIQYFSAGVLEFQEHEVNIYPPLAEELRRCAPEEAAEAHGRIAELCLLYLSFSHVQQAMAEMYEHQPPDDEAPAIIPRDDLVTYAVMFWHQHYRLAGSSKPTAQAKAFFANTHLRNVWFGVLEHFSHPWTRLNKSYLSCWPMIARVGLDDLLTDAVKSQTSKASLLEYCDLALLEAIRHQHVSCMKLLLQTQTPDRDTVSEALVIAAATGDEQRINYFIKLAAELDDFAWPQQLLSRLCWIGLAESLTLLIDSGAAIPEPQPGDLWQNFLYNPPIEARHGNIVKILLDAQVKTIMGDGEEFQVAENAAWRGDPPTLKMLLAAGVDMNIRKKGGMTGAVNWAVVSGKPKSVQILLENNIDSDVGLESCDMENYYYRLDTKPLQIAVSQGHAECARLLLEAGTDVNSTLNDRTALWYAVSKGNLKISKMLLEHGADPNENPEGHDPVIFKAIASGLETAKLIELLDLLFRHKVDAGIIDTNDKLAGSVLLRAVILGNREVVEFLLDKGVSVDLGAGEVHTAAFKASQLHQNDILRLLIDRKANLHLLSSLDRTPLHGVGNEPETAQLLLDAGVDVNVLSTIGTATYLAAYHGHLDVLKVLLAHEPRPDLEIKSLDDPTGQGIFTYEDGTFTYEQGMTALCIACRNGHVACLKLLLQNGANPNAQTKDNSFPLEYCLHTQGSDPLALVEAILLYKTNVKQIDDYQHAVLHSIGESTPVDVVRLLVMSGADAYAVDAAGETPLMRAALSKNTEVAKFLLSAGVDANTYTRQHGSILSIAATTGNWELFKLLLEKGADMSLAQQQGYEATLLHSAISDNIAPWTDDRREIVKYLVEEKKVDINERCPNQFWAYPIIKAGGTCNHADVEYLLDHGADPDVQDNAGRRLIHLGSYAYAEMAKRILTRLKAGGIDMWPKTKVGMSPFHFAAARPDELVEYLEMIPDFLSDTGSDAAEKPFKNAPDDGEVEKEGKETETGSEAEMRQKRLMTRLPINERDNDGWTPLMWASKANWDSSDALNRLVELGADLWATGKVRNSKGVDEDWTALKIAHSYGCTQAVYDALTPTERTRIVNGVEETWNDEDHEARERNWESSKTCDHCRTLISGIYHRCTICIYILCYKCNRGRDLIHPGHAYEPVGVEFVGETEETQAPGFEGDKSSEDAVDGNGGRAGAGDEGDETAMASSGSETDDTEEEIDLGDDSDDE